MKKKTIFLLIIVLIIVGIIYILPKKTTGEEIQTAKVVKHNLNQTVEASGTVNPVQSVNIGSQISGRIYKIYADYNSKVKKGQLLAEIDPSLLQASVDKARGEVNTATSNYKKTEAKLIYYKANYERYERLYKKHYVSKDEVEEAYST